MTDIIVGQEQVQIKIELKMRVIEMSAGLIAFVLIRICQCGCPLHRAPNVHDTVPFPYPGTWNHSIHQRIYPEIYLPEIFTGNG